MQIVPAIYITEGKAAAYKPGNYEDLEILPIDPYEIIQRLDDLNIGHLGLIDIDASLGNGRNQGLIGSLANTAVATLHVGGGICDMDYLKSLQYAGVDDFIMGSAQFDAPGFLESVAAAEDIQNERVSIAVDIRDGKLSYRGWTEEASLTLNAAIRRVRDMGFDHFVCSDATKRDEAQGPNYALYEQLMRDFPNCHFAAAGNVNSFEDIERFEKIGLRAVIVGNDVYKVPGLLEQIAQWNESRRKGMLDAGLE